MLQSDPGFHGPRVPRVVCNLPIFTWFLFHKTFQNLLSVHNGVFPQKNQQKCTAVTFSTGCSWSSKMWTTTEMPKNDYMVKTWKTFCFFSVKPKESWNMTCLKPSNLTFESAVSSVSSQILSQVSCIHTNTWCFSRYPLALQMAFFRGRVTLEISSSGHAAGSGKYDPKPGNYQILTYPLKKMGGWNKMFLSFWGEL